MGKKNKSKKEGKGDKKKNQKNDNSLPESKKNVIEDPSPVLNEQKEEDTPPQDTETPSTPEVVDLPPSTETADANLEQVQGDAADQLQSSEDWSVVAPHQPHVEDYESTLLMPDEKHSPAQSVSGKEPQPLLVPNSEAAEDTFEDAQAEPAQPDIAGDFDDSWEKDFPEEPEHVVPSDEVAEQIPETTEAAPEAAEPAPEPTEPAPEAAKPTSEETEQTPETTEQASEEQPAPEGADKASEEAAEPAPEAAEPTPEATEEVTEPAPEPTEPTEPTLEGTEQAPEEATEQAPEATEPSDEAAEQKLETTEPSPEATEQTPEEAPEKIDEDIPAEIPAEAAAEPTEQTPEETPEPETKVSAEEPAEDDWGHEAFEEPAEVADPTESTENKGMPEGQQQEEKEVDSWEDREEPEQFQDLPEETDRELPAETTAETTAEIPAETSQEPPALTPEDTPADTQTEAGQELPAEAAETAEVKHDHPEDDKEAPAETEPEPTEDNPVTHSIASPTPRAPAPAPLPSPVPSQPRSVHSPAPAPPADHPLSRRGSPLAYHTSPSYKYASPQMQAYNPYMIGMPGPPPMHPGSVASPSASFATAYHSPTMEHTPMASPHMYPRRGSAYPNGARDYSNGYYNGRMDRTLSGGSGHSYRMDRTNSQHAEEDPGHEHHHLLGRIEKAMPDITRLLDSFKETRNKLQASEAESRQLQAQHEQAIMHKDFYIEALQGQMKKAATETAEEYSKFKDVISGLRMELGNQQEKAKDLKEYLDASRKQNEELETLKSELESEIQTLQKKIEELQIEHERALEEAKEHERSELATQKEELTNLFEEIRAEDEAAANERYNEREKELLDEQAALKSEWEEKQRGMEEAHDNMRAEHETAINDKHAELQKTLSDLETAKSDLQAVSDSLVHKSEDLENKERELDATKEELEAKLIEIKQAQDDLHNKQDELHATQAELQTTLDELESRKSELDNKHKELEEAHKQHSEEKEELIGSHSAALDTMRDGHSTELNTLRDTHSNEIDNLRSTHETASKEMEERFDKLSRDYNEKEKTWAAEKSTLQRHLNEKLDEIASMERERESLERDDMMRERQLQSAVDEMRRTIDNMENDREKLRKTLTSLGEATDLKTSKGDQFFVDSFNQLCQLIVDLSKEHFSYLPIDPPKDILEKIPPDMPSFLDNTTASRELRSAYIQHVISKTLTYRIFQPFLFTLGRRYDKADTFFQVLSMDIRRKSVRREAFWRQQTLKAAYTTSDAKQSINVVAAVIVDEIVDHIKHFADPKQLDALLGGVRRIVKLAAETWRHARVERELVLATMPAPESGGDVNDGWDEYTCGRAVEGVNGNSGSGSSSNESGRHVLLRVFPRIYREAAHEDFADDKEKMNACIYYPGTILYSNSPSVIARREEQGQKSNGETVRSSTP
ncbi:hypothetical protein UA08_07801 [Talaromyces atroroseus]|uniref:RNA polymerase Rpb1 C-terminal repeat domain-containing protein n=1 Tax=Talaromyces atroroseus TaxID=1441469 RepID=A0A225AMY9_TALAT|nr:hypothetical protein UA08_07801 [Talaromyces atroroseus]OKL56959.1 hypothetical protein UA08_07801 [Talaromyces atroroseus]